MGALYQLYGYPEKYADWLTAPNKGFFTESIFSGQVGCKRLSVASVL